MIGLLLHFVLTFGIQAKVSPSMLRQTLSQNTCHFSQLASMAHQTADLTRACPAIRAVKCCSTPNISLYDPMTDNNAPENAVYYENSPITCTFVAASTMES